MGVIVTGNFSKALWPGVHEFWGIGYNVKQEQYKDIFEVLTSEKNFEEDVATFGFSLAPVKGEGENIVYDSHNQGITKRYTHVTYGLGYALSREEIEDNLYPELVRDRSQALGNSVRQTIETVCANTLNNGFDSNYTGADAVALFSTAHPTGRGYTYQNTLTTSADLSEASLEQACIDITTLKDEAGLVAALMPEKLIIPPSLIFDAERILKSNLQNDSANNAINAMRNTGMLQGYVVNQFLTDTDAWFIKTSAQKGLRMFMRRAPSVAEDEDFDSENVKYKSTVRFSVGWTDARGIYGSQGA